MSDAYSTEDLKKDELSLTSVASDLQEDLKVETEAEQEIPARNVYEEASCSSILESSDPLAMKPESHSVSFRTSVVAKRYKITLAQARRTALNVAKRAQRRRERLSENEAKAED